jgi:hypothetical protein
MFKLAKGVQVVGLFIGSLFTMKALKVHQAGQNEKVTRMNI